jgi:hypothetical protein
VWIWLDSTEAAQPGSECWIFCIEFDCCGPGH